MSELNLSIFRQDQTIQPDGLVSDNLYIVSSYESYKALLSLFPLAYQKSIYILEYPT